MPNTQTDIYAEYCAGQAQATERWITLSDGVQLKLIDFQPNTPTSTRPLLFVAGWISLIDGWKQFLPTFTANRRVLYLETREKYSAQLPVGESGKRLDVAFDMPRMTLDLQEVVLAEGLTSAGYDLVGSSLGATTITEYLAVAAEDDQAPEPHKAALIAPNADFPFPKWGLPIMRYGPSVLWTIFKPVLKWYLRNFRVSEPEQAAKYQKTIDQADLYKLRRNAVALIDYEIWSKLPAINTPTLVIAASSDKLHGIDNIQRMGELIAQAQIEILESNKATHAQPCSAAIVEFLQD